MIWLKFFLLKIVAGIASLVAMADVSILSNTFFYQPEIPAQLKK